MTPKEEKGWAIRSTIIAYFGLTNLYKNGDEAQQMFLENLLLCICKGCMVLLSCKNIWLHILILHQCSCVVFLFHPSFVEQFFSYNNHEDHELACIAKLESTNIASCSFDLWMSRNGVDTFAWSLIISMKLGHLSMLLRGCLKCIKLLTMPWLCSFKFYWKNLVSFTLWLLLWKMKITTLELWLQHCNLLLTMKLWSFFRFMKLFVLGMWYMSKSC